MATNPYAASYTSPRPSGGLMSSATLLGLNNTHGSGDNNSKLMDVCAGEPTALDESEERAFESSWLSLLLGPLLGALLYGAFCWANPAGLTESGRRLAGCTIWIAVWWVTESLPLGVSSLLPILLFPLFKIQPSAEVTANFGNKSIFLFFGGVQVAYGLERCGLHTRIAMFMLRIVGTAPHRIMLGFCLGVSLLSMFMSNTTTTVMMMPVGLQLAATLGDGDGDGNFGKALMLSIAYSASIGGMGTITGTGTNIVLQKLGPQFGIPMDFFTWMSFAAPMAMALIVVLWVFLVLWFKVSCEPLPADHPAQAVLQRCLGPWSQAEVRVGIIFGITVVLWMTRDHLNSLLGWEESQFGDETVAILATVALFFVTGRDHSGKKQRLLDWKTLLKTPWDILFLFGGGFALGAAFDVTGLSAWLGSQLTSLQSLSHLIMILTIVLVVTFLTEFTSNVVTANVLLPVLGQLACHIDLAPALLMIPATLACSCAFMMPVATPPNAVVFSSGMVKMKEMVGTGIVLNLTTAVFITLYVMCVGEFYYDFDFDLDMCPSQNGSTV